MKLGLQGKHTRAKCHRIARVPVPSCRSPSKDKSITQDLSVALLSPQTGTKTGYTQGHKTLAFFECWESLCFGELKRYVCLFLQILGKKNKLRVYYLSWLRNKILRNDPEVEKRQGWVSVGDLEGCVHYKVGKDFMFFPWRAA